MHVNEDWPLQIVEQVDENWLRGRLKEQVGLVPCQFVEHLPGIQLAPHQSLYRAHTDYQSTHEGDLQFRQGKDTRPLTNLTIISLFQVIF